MKIFRIDYMLNSNKWSCTVVSKDQNDALNFLRQSLRSQIQVIGIENRGPLHGISDTVKKMFMPKEEFTVDPEGPKNVLIEKSLVHEDQVEDKRMRGEEQKDITQPKEEETNPLQCEICGQECKTAAGLSVHKKRAHFV